MCHITIGKKYKCIRDVVMSPGGYISYHKGEEYLSESYLCITNEHREANHRWTDAQAFNTYFDNREYNRKESLSDLLGIIDNKKPD